MNIYVGNLSPEVTEEEVRQAFEAFGQVTSVNIIKDRYTGQPRGFGFVEMPVDTEAQAAIDGLNETPLKEQNLTVSKARPRPESRRSGWSYGGGGRRRY
ncbi:MAG: RNA-binding protein [Dehalococcoidia bacterium]|nr:RNA-binding protein [Dehalococcoidia bacterium]MDH5781937.1 RNA-binding protein [Dehalococcoidia bacterium]